MLLEVLKTFLAAIKQLYSLKMKMMSQFNHQTYLQVVWAYFLDLLKPMKAILPLLDLLSG